MRGRAAPEKMAPLDPRQVDAIRSRFSRVESVVRRRVPRVQGLSVDRATAAPRGGRPRPGPSPGEDHGGRRAWFGSRPGPIRRRRGPRGRARGPHGGGRVLLRAQRRGTAAALGRRDAGGRRAPRRPGGPGAGPERPRGHGRGAGPPPPVARRPGNPDRPDSGGGRGPRARPDASRSPTRSRAS